MTILHLARAAAVAAVETGFGCPVAIRINAIGSDWHTADLAAVAHSRADYMVLPKVESPKALAASGKPLLAMIETPDGVQAAATIARQPGVAGLIAGLLGGAGGYLLASRSSRANLSPGLVLPQSSAGLSTRPDDSIAAVAARVTPSVVSIAVTGAGGGGFSAGAKKRSAPNQPNPAITSSVNPMTIRLLRPGEAS